SVRPPGEGVEDGLFAGWIQLEHHSAARIERACAHGYVAAAVGGAVEIALLVPNQTRGRIGSVSSSREAVKDGLFAAPIHLEHDSAARSVASAEVAAVESRAVEVARPVANDVPQGELPVRPGKRVEYGIALKVLCFLLVLFLCDNPNRHYCQKSQQA